MDSVAPPTSRNSRVSDVSASPSVRTHLLSHHHRGGRGVTLIEAVLTLICVAVAIDGLMRWLREDADVVRARAVAQQITLYANALDAMLLNGKPAELGAIPSGATHDVTAQMHRGGYLAAQPPSDARSRLQMRAWVRHDVNPDGTERYTGLVATSNYTGGESESRRLLKLIGPTAGRRPAPGASLNGLGVAWQIPQDNWQQVQPGQVAVLVPHAGRSDVGAPTVTDVEFVPRNAARVGERNQSPWTPLYFEDAMTLTWSLRAADSATVVMYDEGSGEPVSTFPAIRSGELQVVPQAQWFGRTMRFRVTPDSEGDQAARSTTSDAFRVERYPDSPIQKVELELLSFSSHDFLSGIDDGCQTTDPSNSDARSYNSELAIESWRLFPRNYASATQELLRLLEPVFYSVEFSATHEQLFMGNGTNGPSRLTRAYRSVPSVLGDLPRGGAVISSRRWSNGTSGFSFIARCHRSDQVLLTSTVVIDAEGARFRKTVLDRFQWHADSKSGRNNFGRRTLEAYL